MHELSIAKNIAAITHKIYSEKKYQSTIKTIYFTAGVMNAIIPESLQVNFQAVKQDYAEMKAATLVIHQKEVIIKCRQCGAELTLETPSFFCDRCGSADIEMVQGKEMYVESFEI